MTDFIICVTTNLFRVYLISRFIRIFLSYEEKRRQPDAAYVGIWGIFHS